MDDVVSDAPRVEGLRASPSRIGRTGKSLGYKSQLLCALLSFSRPLEVADLVAALGIARPLARAPYECAGYWCTACSAAARLECGPRDPHYPSHWVMLDGSGLKSIAGAPAAARVGAFEVVPHLQLPDGDADAPGPLVRFLGGSGHDLSKVSGETAPRVSDLEVCLPPD